MGELDFINITKIINKLFVNSYTPQGLAYEIHNYANTQVTTSSTSSASDLSPRTVKLTAAVWDNIQTRLQGKPIITYPEAQKVIKDAIEKCIAVDKQAQANQAVFVKGKGDVDSEFQQQLCLAVSFIQAFHPDKLELWVKGFVEESITAYSSSSDSTSCSKGIKERVVTGLRGIEDPELNQLFAQAEGPKLMSIWVQDCSSALNPSGDANNKQRLARQLGITDTTTGAEASATFKSLAQQKLTEYQIQNVQNFQVQINTTAEMIEEYYETTLKPFAESDKRSSLPAVSNPAR